MNQLLKQFYEQEGLRETVRAFMQEQLKQLAVERVMDKQSVAGIYEANKVIDKTFAALDELYGIIKPQVIENSR